MARKAEGPPDFASAFRHAARWDPVRRAVVVEVEIARGFHAYTAGETTGVPLAFEIDPSGDYLLDGPVVLPPGTEKMLSLGRSMIVEGRAELVAPVKGPPSGRAKGRLKYQVCTDTACDRPRTAPIEVAVTAPTQTPP